MSKVRMFLGSEQYLFNLLNGYASYVLPDIPAQLSALKMAVFSSEEI
jgi:hypothetical protein